MFITYPDNPKESSPEPIIWTLPPTPLMHYTSLVHTPSNQVHGHGDRSDDPEHAGGTNGIGGVGRGPTAGGTRTHLEEVGAGVGCADEGDGGGWGDGVAIAEEGEGGRFSAGIFGWFGGPGRLSGFIVIFVIVVV